MPLLPHAYAFFDSAGLLLRRDGLAFHPGSREWEMTLPEAEGYLEALGRFVQQDAASERPVFTRPLIVSLLGAEPLAEPESLDRLLQLLGSHCLAAEVSTTASWVRSEQQAVEVLGRYRGQIQALRLITSSPILAAPAQGDNPHGLGHAPLDGTERVRIFLDAAKSTGHMVDIRCGVGPTTPIPRPLFELEVVNQGTTFLHLDPAYELLPDDRSDDSAFFLSEPSGLRCAEKFGFFVTPGGAVHPCTAGVGLDELQIGDLSVETVAEVVSRTTGDAELEELYRHGPRSARTGGAGIPVSAGARYADNCDFHRQMIMARRYRVG